MGLGAILVIIGVILAVIDVFLDTSGRVGRATLLHVAVILIGVGVLLGGTDLATD